MNICTTAKEGGVYARRCRGAAGRRHQGQVVGARGSDPTRRQGKRCTKDEEEEIEIKKRKGISGPEQHGKISSTKEHEQQQQNSTDVNVNTTTGRYRRHLQHGSTVNRPGTYCS